MIRERGEAKGRRAVNAPFGFESWLARPVRLRAESALAGQHLVAAGRVCGQGKGKLRLYLQGPYSHQMPATEPNDGIAFRVPQAALAVGLRQLVCPEGSQVGIVVASSASSCPAQE
jgi:hypothetical protein